MWAPLTPRAMIPHGTGVKILGSLRTIVAASFFRCLFRDSTSGNTLRRCFFRSWARRAWGRGQIGLVPLCSPPRPLAEKQTSSVMCNCQWYWYRPVSLWHPQARAHRIEQRLPSPGFYMSHVASLLPLTLPCGVTYVRYTLLIGSLAYRVLYARSTEKGR